MSYKNYKRHLGKIELNKETVERNRLAFFEFYFNYFYNIVVNYFTWEGLPNDIDELFIERKLIENGHVSFFHDDTFGFIAQGGTRGERLNHYDQPLSYQPVSASSMNYFKQMEIAYTENDFRVIEDLHKDNPDKIKKPCIVIPNNNFYEPYIGYLELFCEKLADIELTIQLNRNAQITPYFIFVDNTNVLSMKNIFNKIANFEPVVYLNKQKDQDGQDSFKQLSDYIQVFRTDAPFLLDKLHDEKLRVMNQLLTLLASTTTPQIRKSV